jgi:hypothetical protein
MEATGLVTPVFNIPRKLRNLIKLSRNDTVKDLRQQLDLPFPLELFQIWRIGGK